MAYRPFAHTTERNIGFDSFTFDSPSMERHIKTLSTHCQVLSRPRHEEIIRDLDTRGYDNSRLLEKQYVLIGAAKAAYLIGKRMLYDLCESQGIPYRNCQKWILAQNNQQHEQLVKTHEFSKSIGVPTHFISLTEARTREPDVQAKKAVLESPTTGIIDSHSYMAYLESDFQSKGGDLACHTRVTEIEHQASGSQGYNIQTISSLGEPASITTETLINSAGLAAVPLSNNILPPDRHVKPYYAKGSYYSYAAARPRPKILIYPAPTTGAAGLGTHLTMDMTGAIRFGPDVEWVDDPNDLSVNESRLSAALDEIKAYLPSIDRERVMLDYAGIRPKLGQGSAVASGKGDGFSDFYIKKEEGFDGFINLLGIESPGLTSSLAIADMVDDLLYRE
ncbi:MAG: hypothetical protein Q9223_001784 [Gallowayella weberi]